MDVAIQGDDIHVSIYGGPRNVCGSVRFNFPDPTTREHQAQLLRQWQREEGQPGNQIARARSEPAMVAAKAHIHEEEEPKDCEAKARFRDESAFVQPTH